MCKGRSPRHGGENDHTASDARNYNFATHPHRHCEARAAPTAVEDVEQHGAGRGNPVALIEPQNAGLPQSLGLLRNDEASRSASQGALQ